MSHERLIIAIGRIENALSKIERSPGGSTPPGDPQLEHRHAKLKAEMQTIISEIDRLIAGAVS